MVFVQALSLRPLIRLGAWLLVWTVAVNIALHALSATTLLDWLPDRQTGTGFADDNRQRIKGAESQYENHIVLPTKRLGVIVGISNIREAVDVDMLNQQLGRDWRFIGVAGAGAGAASIVDNARLLEQEKQLRPDLVIVGTAPLQLLDTLLPGAYTPPAPTAMARAKQAVKDLFWMKARRRDVSVSSERALLDARSRLFDAFDVHLATADTRTPWRSMLRVMGSERFPDQAFLDGLTWAHSVGAFEMLSYERSQKAPELLEDTIQNLSSGGSRVIVVFTPEHSMLRSREPRLVGAYLRERMRRDTGVANLVVLDYRAAVSDDGFVDLVHLNKSGSARFTPLLMRDIRGQRWNRPALMSDSN